MVVDSHEGDDFRAWAREVDVADVESVSEGRVIVEHSVDLGAFGAVVAGFGAIDEVVPEQEEDIAFHGGPGSEGSAEVRRFGMVKEKDRRVGAGIAVRNGDWN